jgi:hypothetical protein
MSAVSVECDQQKRSLKPESRGYPERSKISRPPSNAFRVVSDDGIRVRARSQASSPISNSEAETRAARITSEFDEEFHESQLVERRKSEKTPSQFIPFSTVSPQSGPYYPRRALAAADSEASHGRKT